MHKLYYDEAVFIEKRARSLAKSTNTRVGQCIMNALPLELYKSISGTDNDFFYWEDKEKAVCKFWEVCT